MFIENKAVRLLSTSLYKPLGAGLTTKTLNLMPGMNEVTKEEWEEMMKVNGRDNPTLSKWLEKGLLKIHSEKPAEPKVAELETPKKKNKLAAPAEEEPTKGHIVML